MQFIKVCHYLFCIFSLSLLLGGELRANEYQHVINVGKMTFHWSVEGERLVAKISAPTTGWVGVGFNPTDTMKDANIILGFVKDGKAEISNEFGVAPTRHAPSNKTDAKDGLTVISGTETGNTTTLEFSIPLRNPAPNGGVIDPKTDTRVILAYGPDMKSTKLKHQFATTVSVNLGSGIMK